jgi:nucleotide-binding universal stress UspA family protein
MKVLCAIDGSRYSEWALELIPQIVEPATSVLALVHAVDAAKFKAARRLGTTTEEAIEHALELAEQGGARLLERARRDVMPTWVGVRTKLLKGEPAHAVVHSASRSKAELIVLGSRGLTDFRPFLLGSVSRRVIMHAPCPVLIVKRRVPVLRRVIVGTDGSRYAKRAVDFLLALHLSKDVRITVAAVVAPLPIEAGHEPRSVTGLADDVRHALLEQAEDIAQEANLRLTREGFDATGRVTHGHVGPELVALAETEKADLILVGSRGLTGATRNLMGSVSDSIVKYAPCPVLVVRH